MSDIIVAQQGAQETRAAQAENQARFATYATTHITTGNGFFIDKVPIVFGCSFLVEPIIAHGISIVRAPDTKHWQYPIANSGVYKWMLEANPADSGKSANDPTITPFYVGAYVYFAVKIDPLIYPRTDGSNLAALNAQLTTATGDLRTTLEANIAEATEALYLRAHPPTCVLTHSLSFAQVATKNLTDAVTQNLNSDPAVLPNVPPLGARA